MADNEPNHPDDYIIVVLEVNEDATEYCLKIKATNNVAISDHDFIMHVESWLHEVTQAEITKKDSGTSLH